MSGDLEKGREVQPGLGAGSNPLWPLYNAEADRFDKELTETWKSDMQTILIFAGLFSGVVTTFIVDSYHNLSQDPNAITIGLLTRISLQLSNKTDPAAPISANDISFSQDSNAVSVNAFWILSLVFSLTAALMAIMIIQWAGNYTRAIERPRTDAQRAMARAYLFSGIEVFKPEAVVEAVPILIHIALFLFFSGLIQFLWPISLLIAGLVLTFISLVGTGYIIITVLPILKRNSPFQTPISDVCWRGLRRIRMIFARSRPTNIPSHIWKCQQIEAEKINNQGLERLTSALCWTVDTLQAPSQIEPFVAGICDMLSSGVGLSSTDILLLQRLVQTAASSIQSPIGRRIAYLLRTSRYAGPMIDGIPRLNRARTCLRALWELHADPLQSGIIKTRWIDHFDHYTPGIVLDFTKDPSPELSSQAACTSAVIQCKLAMDISAYRTKLAEAKRLVDGKDLELRTAEEVAEMSSSKYSDDITRRLNQTKLAMSTLASAWVYPDYSVDAKVLPGDALTPEVIRQRLVFESTREFGGLELEARYLIVIGMIESFLNGHPIGDGAIVARTVEAVLTYRQGHQMTDPQLRVTFRQAASGVKPEVQRLFLRLCQKVLLAHRNNNAPVEPSVDGVPLGEEVVQAPTHNTDDSTPAPNPVPHSQPLAPSPSVQNMANSTAAEIVHQNPILSQAQIGNAAGDEHSRTEPPMMEHGTSAPTDTESDNRPSLIPSIRPSTLTSTSTTTLSSSSSSSSNNTEPDTMPPGCKLPPPVTITLLQALHSNLEDEDAKSKAKFMLFEVTDWEPADAVSEAVDKLLRA